MHRLLSRGPAFFAGIVLASSALLTFGRAGFADTDQARRLALRSSSDAATSLETSIGALRERYRRPTSAPQPPENVSTEAKVRLGRTLFFDPRLSGSNFISCATCHNPGFCWSDGLPRAIGHGMKTLARKTPTIIDTAWAAALFWDGRADTLEEQALGPIAAPGEMNLPHAEMVIKLDGIAGYRPLFQDAFGPGNVTKEHVAAAIASFERTIRSSDSAFDRWVAGSANAIPAAAKRGFALFNGSAGCAKCHSGWRFTDDSFHDIGVVSADVGRGNVLKEIDSMQYAFKTPTLRNVTRRAPYMHDGSEKTLADVVDLYDRGGRVRRPTLAPEIHQIGLTPPDKQDLVAFLKALETNDPATFIPELPR